METPLGIKQILLARPPERGSVRVARAEVGVPRVEVGVEVQHRDRAVLAVQRAQQREGDRVVATQGEQPTGALLQGVGAALDVGCSAGVT